MSIPSDRRPVPGFLQLLVTGLYATPAVALLDGVRTRQLRSPLAWLAALALAALTAAGFYAAVSYDGAWTVASIGWVALIAVGALAVATAVSLRARVERPQAAPAWGRRTLLAGVLVIFVMPPLYLFSRLLSSAVLEPLLIRLGAPVSMEPLVLLQSYLFFAIGWIPLGALFAARSLRAGRLTGPGDLGRAVAAWLFVLIVTRFLVSGPVAALHRLMLGGDDFEDSQRMLLSVLFAVATAELALRLAWGRGWWPLRTLATTLLALVAFLNLGLAVGYAPRVSFALGRYAERVGRIDQALEHYGRSLRARSSPRMESYLQHRVGLLHYKLGDEQRARDAFRRVVTTHDYSDELVEQASYYLTQLDKPPGAERVVLEGVELTTEGRAGYCAPNTTALVLRFLGVDVTPGWIGERYSEIGSGTSLADISRAVRELGMEQLLVPLATLDDLRWLIDQGYPVMLYEQGHVFAVFGYDQRLGTFVTFDTATWDTWVDETVPGLEQRWADFDFLLGVVVPPGPQGDVVRERFATARALAARHLWLAFAPGTDAARQLRAAVAADTSFFRAAFYLRGQPGSRDWMARHADLDAVAKLALEFMQRSNVNVEDTGFDLARWLYSYGRDSELFELASELEQRDALGRTRLTLALAAHEQGEHELAWRIVEPAPPELLGGFKPGFALEAGERERAAAILEQGPAGWAAPSRNMEEEFDKQSCAALPAALELAEGRSPGFLEQYLSTYVDLNPWDTGRALLYAELNLRALEMEGDAARAERLQTARRHALLARSGSDDPELVARAEAVLAEVERLAAE